MRSFVKFLFCAAVVSVNAEPNPPNWDGRRVKIIDAGNGGAQKMVDDIFHEMGGNGFHGQWSDSRYAIMFKPGNHHVNVRVGFYTQVLGLGETPKDVTVSGLGSPDGSSDPHHGALANFWRAAENMQVNSHVVWSVSQACPIRRMQINNNLDLASRGYSSGGFMADVYATGTVNSGSQQQWMSRNSHFGRWSGGNWNMVFSGCVGAPSTHCGTGGGRPYTNVQSSPLIAEKPYISESGGKYFLNVPHVEHNKVGTTNGWRNAEKIDFSRVFVANEHTSAQTITSKIDAGLHVVLQPGNY